MIVTEPPHLTKSDQASRSIGKEDRLQEFLAAEQGKIIRAILTSGLQGGTDLQRFGAFISKDVGLKTNRIDGILVNPNYKLSNTGVGVIPRLETGDSFRYLDQEELRLSEESLRLLMLSETLHKGNSSVFGVVFERQDESIDQISQLPREELESRANASFIVAAHLQDISRLADGKPRDKLEYPITPPVLPIKFWKVLAPNSLIPVFNAVLSDIEFPVDKFVPVSSEERILHIPRVSPNSQFADIEVPTVLQVPNYYDFFANQFSSEPLWIHGIRLPTYADIIKRQS